MLCFVRHWPWAEAGGRGAVVAVAVAVAVAPETFWTRPATTSCTCGTDDANALTTFITAGLLSSDSSPRPSRGDVPVLCDVDDGADCCCWLLAGCDAFACRTTQNT